MGDRGQKDLERPKETLKEIWEGGLRTRYLENEQRVPESMVKPLCKITYMSPDDLNAVLKIMAAKADAKEAETLLADSLKDSGVEEKVIAYVRDVEKLASGKTGSVVVDDLRQTLKRLGHKGLDKRGNRPRLLKLLWDLKVSKLKSTDSSDEDGEETLDDMRERHRKAKEKLDADLDKLDAAEDALDAARELAQPADEDEDEDEDEDVRRAREDVLRARADDADVRGADDVTERRDDQPLPPSPAYVRPQRVRKAPTHEYYKYC